MPLNGTPPPYMNPRPGGMLPPAMGAPPGAIPNGAPGGYGPPAPTPRQPGMLTISPNVEGQMPVGPLPPGVQMFEDGSALVSPETARILFANQAGGSALPQGPPPMMGPPGGIPGGMPADFGAPPGMFAGPPGAAPMPPIVNQGMMPGQPPPAPTDPAGMVMAGLGGPPAPLPPPRDVIVPGGAGIVGGVPTAAPPPRPADFESLLRATAPAGSNPSIKKPTDRLRGEKKPGSDRRRR